MVSKVETLVEETKDGELVQVQDLGSQRKSVVISRFVAERLIQEYSTDCINNDEHGVLRCAYSKDVETMVLNMLYGNDLQQRSGRERLKTLFHEFATDVYAGTLENLEQ
jgi:hypothetical protein